MNSKELRELQLPLKQNYTKNPETAVFTLSAEGNIGEGISCSLETGKGIIEAGLHEASGGNGLMVCSGEMLLEALVACSGVTLKAVATALDIEIRSGKVRALGVLDFKGTLGVSKDVLVGFKNIQLFFELETEAEPEHLAVLKKLTDRYCMVFQTLLNGVKLESTIESIN